MPAKNICEAVDRAMARSGDFKKNLKGELRDLFAHQSMTFGNPIGTIAEKCLTDTERNAIILFFKHMFKDIPTIAPAEPKNDDDSGALGF